MTIIPVNLSRVFESIYILSILHAHLAIDVASRKGLHEVPKERCTHTESHLTSIDDNIVAAQYRNRAVQILKHFRHRISLEVRLSSYSCRGLCSARGA